MNALTWRSILLKLTAGSNLSSAETGWAIAQTVGGQASSIEIAAFLVALRTKGETAEELHGVVQALLDGAIRIDLPFACHDIAGTGGDGTGAMNISTLAAMVAAGSGCTVVKHGGRAASSTTAGSADLVEALGIPLVVSPDDVRHAAMSRRFSYLFAPVFNPGLRHAIDARRGLGIPTVINLAAPLINPVRPANLVVGVADERRVETIAETMRLLGRSGLVIRGHDGLDKCTTTTTSDVWIVRPSGIRKFVLDPRALGLMPATLSDLRGGSAAENAELARALLRGQAGPLRDIVLLNAAAVITAGTLTIDHPYVQLAEAIDRAAEAIDSGSAGACLGTD